MIRILQIAKKNVDKTLTKSKKDTDRELTNAKKKTDKVLTKAKSDTDRELTSTKENIDKELTKIKEDADRELTTMKFDVDNNLTIAREDIVTEWNYFWATVCGESQARKSIQRKYDQGLITAEERDSLQNLEPAPESCGFGISADSENGVVLTDANGSPSEKPIDEKYDDLPDILDWNKEIEMQEWEKSISDKWVAGMLISPDISGGVTWFHEVPGPVTKSNNLRKSFAGFPMVGARRTIKVLDKNGNPVLDENGKQVYKYRLHKGTDYATKENDQIYASFDGRVTFHKSVHKGFHMVRVTDRISGHTQETLYVKDSEISTKLNGSSVKRGDVIGVSDNIQRHPDYKNVPNHVHVNYKSPEGIYLAPNNKFGVTGNSEWLAEHCENAVCLAPNSK